jgi:hypothetical protein
MTFHRCTNLRRKVFPVFISRPDDIFQQIEAVLAGQNDLRKIEAWKQVPILQVRFVQAFLTGIEEFATGNQPTFFPLAQANAINGAGALTAAHFRVHIIQDRLVRCFRAHLGLSKDTGWMLSRAETVTLVVCAPKIMSSSTRERKPM